MVNGSVGRTPGADATEATDRSQEGDAAWFRRLCTGSDGARALQDHLASMEHRLDTGGADAAISQAIRNREAFLAALHHSATTGAPFPCGLAQHIPKYVAIVNLSGKRLLLTSENDVLVRALCARSSRSTPRELAQQLHRFFLWVESALIGSSSAFVLVTYSLPWQVGLASAYWEINTVAIAPREDGSKLVMDRHLSFSSLSEDTFTARPTLSTRTIDEATRAAFAVEYVAVDLDATDDDARITTDDDGVGAKHGGGGAAVAENVRLRSLIVALRAQTRSDRDELRTLQATLKIRRLLYGRGVAKAELKAAKAADAADARVAIANVERDRLRTTSQQLLVEQAEATKRADEAQRQVEKLRRQERAKDGLHNAAMAKKGDEINRLAGQLASSQRAAEEEREEARRAHEREREGLVARAAQERAGLQEALQFKERALNQLAEVNEARSLDLEAARAELARAAAEGAARDVAIAALRAELAAAEAAATTVAAVATTTTTAEASVATDSRGTTTHHHSTTQTGDARVVAEDLPESMRAALPASAPPHATAAAAPVAMAAAPVVMTPPPPMCLHGALPRPFGTPQSTMGAVRFHMANLMNWTAYLESELLAAAQCEPHPFYAPPQGPPQGPPQHRRGRMAR